MLFRVGIAQAVALISFAATVVSASNPTLSTNLPEFVSHIDREALQAALQVANERHTLEVSQALSDYDTDAVEGNVETDVVENARFEKHRILAPGTLPDFANQLERAVYVSNPPLFPKEECDRVIQMAEDFVGDKPWGRLDSGQYEISGVWIKDVPALREWFNDAVRRRVFPLLQRLYPDFVDDPADLCVDSAYLFKYTPETGRRTDVHIDCGCLSMTIALNSNDEYEGGGTFFEGLEGQDGDDDSKIVKMSAGQVTLRPGGVRHAGCAIEKGTRYIIGGFCMNRKRVEHLRMLTQKDPSMSEEKTQQLLEAAIALNPKWDYPYNMLADIYIQKGDKEKGRQILEYALANVHPGSAELAYPLSSLYLEQKKYDRVIECAEVCLKMDDHDIDALTVLAEAKTALGESEAAEQAYLRIVTAAAASDKAVASAYCNLGVLHEGSDGEIEFYLKSLERVPQKNFSARYSIGAAYASRKQWDEALPHFREAVDSAQNAQDKEDALKSLYRVAKQHIQTSGETDLSDRNAVLARFQGAMGVANYEALAALSRKQ